MITNKKIYYFTSICIIFCLISSLRILAQTRADNNSIEFDRIKKDMLKSDYINVSLIVASPGKEVYSAAGHAALRMECSSKKIDYCYEFDTDVSISEMIDYMNGDMNASLYRQFTTSYIKRYKEQGRAITGIKLNLTPIQKATLWGSLDKEADSYRKHGFDFMTNNCSSVARMFVVGALGDDIIKYNQVDSRLSGTYRETIPYVFERSPWAQLFWNIMMGTEFDSNPGFESLLFPQALLNEWSKATIISENGNERKMVLEKYTLSDLNSARFSFTPFLLFVIMIIISVAISLLEFKIGYNFISRVWDVILMFIETSVGLFLSYLLIFSHQVATSWNWLIIVFSPLPLFVWTLLRNSKLLWKVYLLFSVVLTFYILLTCLIPQMQYGFLSLLLIVFDVRTLYNLYITNKSSHFY